MKPKLIKVNDLKAMWGTDQMCVVIEFSDVFNAVNILLPITMKELHEAIHREELYNQKKKEGK